MLDELRAISTWEICALDLTYELIGKLAVQGGCNREERQLIQAALEGAKRVLGAVLDSQPVLAFELPSETVSREAEPIPSEPQPPA